jgi:uncharacterized protein YecE (DUF72 family)
MAKWYLGTIGFGYKDWQGPFYPARTPQRERLSYYSKVFNAVELDTTFYAAPRQSSVQAWAASTPPEFRFCAKTPRLITHELGLKDAQGLMLEFVESLTPLQDKLGPILIQLPPKYTEENYSVLREFLEYLPQAYKFAIEFRHRSWYNAKTAELLSLFNICWVSVDLPNLPKQISPTTNFLYIRWIGLHGTYKHHTYERVDKTTELKWWMDGIKPYLVDRQLVYGFFNNDYAGYAAGTCNRFKAIAGLSINEPEIPLQGRLF